LTARSTRISKRIGMPSIFHERRRVSVPWL
jgi:hypothetical protein